MHAFSKRIHTRTHARTHARTHTHTQTHTHTHTHTHTPSVREPVECLSLHRCTEPALVYHRKWRVLTSRQCKTIGNSFHSNHSTHIYRLYVHTRPYTTGVGMIYREPKYSLWGYSFGVNKNPVTETKRQFHFSLEQFSCIFYSFVWVAVTLHFTGLQI